MKVFPEISVPLLWAMAGIFVLLLLASATTITLVRLRPERDFTELSQRVRSWWVMASVFAVAIGLDRRLSFFFLGFVSFLALKEFLSLIPTRRADRRVLFWAYLAIPVQFFWASQAWYGMFIIFIPVYLFLLLPMRMILVGETEGFLKAVGTVHWGVMTTVFCLSHLAYLLILDSARTPAGGAGLLLFVVFLTQFNDVAQYISGKLLGRRKVIPKVSPNKTVEGLLGGVVTTLGLSVLIAPFLTPLYRHESLAAGLIISFGGFVGDVVMSAVKRDLGIKHSGSILPGHGGILDRVDSLTFTAPLFFHYIYYLHY